MNTAFTRVDAILNRGAVDKDLATPPGSPSSGDVYIVASSATGDWAGEDDSIAYYDQSWKFITPNEGMTLWVNDEDHLYSYDGTSWAATASGRQSLYIPAIQIQPAASKLLVSPVG